MYPSCAFGPNTHCTGSVTSFDEPPAVRSYTSMEWRFSSLKITRLFSVSTATPSNVGKRSDTDRIGGMTPPMACGGHWSDATPPSCGRRPAACAISIAVSSTQSAASSASSDASSARSPGALASGDGSAPASSKADAAAAAIRTRRICFSPVARFAGARGVQRLFVARSVRRFFVARGFQRLS